MKQHYGSVVRYSRIVGSIGSILDIVSYQNRFSKFPEDRDRLNIIFEGLRNIGIVSISFWRVFGISVSFRYHFGVFYKYLYRIDIENICHLFSRLKSRTYCYNGKVRMVAKYRQN